ncbi:MAG: bifunctional nuclease family protein [Candidatus Latescibacteria bacterium]|nr:bifunctional nuclease family protein [Candidatus Latescibacterota bacterium]
MIEVGISGLLIDLANQAVLLLKEEGGDRLLPIWIGKMEANAIVCELSKQHPARPLAHDLLSTIIRNLGVEVTRVLISDFVDGVYSAEISLRMGSQRIIKLDARPSDGICLALKSRLPIYAAGHVMERCGVVYRHQEGTSLSSAEALRDHISRINPEDFGNYRFT